MGHQRRYNISWDVRGGTPEAVQQKWYNIDRTFDLGFLSCFFIIKDTTGSIGAVVFDL